MQPRWIRQAITRSIADQHVQSSPVHMIETINKLNRILVKCYQEWVAKRRQKSLLNAWECQKVRFVKRKIEERTYFYGTPIGDDDDHYLGDFIEDSTLNWSLI